VLIVVVTVLCNVAVCLYRKAVSVKMDSQSEVEQQVLAECLPGRCCNYAY